MVTLGARLQSHFATCAAAGLAIALNAPSAPAAIVYSGIVNLTIPSTTNGLYLNVVTGVYNSSGGTGATVPGWTINPWGTTNLSFFVSGSPVATQHILRTGGGGVANLSYGDIVAPQGMYGGWGAVNVNAFTTGNQPFILNSAQNFYGFRFTWNGSTHYGWARIALGNSLNAPRQLIEYAWENNPDTPIWFILEPWGSCCYGTSCMPFVDYAGCAQSGGVWQGQNSYCTPNPCLQGCQADIAPVGGDGVVNVPDLLAIINQWGICPLPPSTCTADIDHNSHVDVGDLLFVINHWGACP